MSLSPNMTLEQLTLRVAEQATMIEQDTDSGRRVAQTADPLGDILLRAVQDGAKEFEDAHDWAWKDVGVELTLKPDGDGPFNIDESPTRYMLPGHFEGIPHGECFWKFGTAYGGLMSVRHAADVARAEFLCPGETGSPQIIGGEYSRALAPGIGQSGGIEIRVAPAPDQEYTAYFRSRLGSVPLCHNGQRGHWPACHDLTVVAFAVRRLFLTDREAGDRARAAAEAEVTNRLALSINRDNTDFKPDEITSAGANVMVRRRRWLAILDNTTGQYISNGLDGLG